MKTCLTIAGSDCSGGAGIQADLKTFSALGCFGMSVITAVVAENTCRVISIGEVSPAAIGDQLDAVFEDIPPDAVKIGMLPTEAAMRSVAGKLRQYRPGRVVTDPVMVAKGGGELMEPAALIVLKREILPLTLLLTPNIPEAESITGLAIGTTEEMREAAKAISALGVQNVLVKGGHLAGTAVDILYDGSAFYTFEAPRIQTKNTHGTGCTLSSAITAGLARGLSVRQSVAEAKEYVTEAIRHALTLGSGYGPTNHFYEYYRMKGYEDDEKL